MSSLNSTTLNLQTPDVVNGIGTIKFVLNVLTDGTSTLTRFAFLLTISVHHMTVLVVTVLHVSQDIFFQMEYVNWQILFANHQLNQEHVHNVTLDIY